MKYRWLLIPLVVPLLVGCTVSTPEIVTETAIIAQQPAPTHTPYPTHTPTSAPTDTPTTAPLSPTATPLPPTATSLPPSATPVSLTPTLPAETPHTPTVAEIMTQGEELSFEVCGESTTWERPTELEQNAKWWYNLRYAGGDEQVVKHPWTHHFFVAYGHGSGEYDLTNLSGLWTLSGDVRVRCFEPERHDAILRLQTAEVWALLYRVKSVKRLDTYYVIVVEPMESGVQFVQFARPEHWLPLTLHFVTEDGQEVGKIVEAESLYWPYPQLIPTPRP